jgi:2-polyprenyl-6-methoxyphenol hydroxylase-like FAD-dependent oxidoreductase
MTVTVMVIGAGIGGLTAALSLNAAGFDVCVYESAADITATGFGINLQPNAVRELIELGLGDALAATAIETTELNYYNKLGQLISSEPRGRAAGYSWPQYAIDRSDLQKILLDTVEERIGAENVSTGHHLISFEQDDSGVTARFIDRRSGQHLPSNRGDVLIGCDGIHSAVRAQLHPAEGAPVVTGRIQWRGVLEAEPFLGGRTHATVGFSGQQGVAYPISNNAAGRGCSRISWVGSLLDRQLASSRYANQGRKIPNERVFERFRNWNFSWLNFADLIRRTGEIYEYLEMDRDPLPRWSFGRVTLLGDAAHPMRSTGAQAGSQAIVDARVLAFALAEASAPERGLEQYEAQHRPIMNAVTLRNREFGPAIAMELVEQRAPQGFGNIEEVITRRELEQISLAYQAEAGFDPTTLNQRPSLTVRRGVPVAG